MTVSSSLSCSFHARVEHTACMTSFVARIIHSLLHWVMISTSERSSTANLKDVWRLCNVERPPNNTGIFHKVWENRHVVWCIPAIKSESWSHIKTGVWSQAQGNKQMQSSFKLAQLLERNDNKTDLFNFLADKIEQMPSPNMVIVTKEENALSNHTISLECVPPCSH